MESTGPPGCIHASGDTRALVGGAPTEWLPTGGVSVKGKVGGRGRRPLAFTMSAPPATPPS